MPTPRRLLDGKKTSNTHTTVIEDAQDILAAAKRLPQVTKVRNGVITGKGNAHPRLKIRTLKAGLLVIVHGTNASQELYLYTKEPELVADTLRERWEKERAA